MNVSQISGKEESFSTSTLRGVADAKQSVTTDWTRLDGAEGKEEKQRGDKLFSLSVV